MHIRSLLPFLLMPLILTFTGCELLGADRESSDLAAYPTTYPALSASEMQARQDAFHDMHGGFVCTPLDRFGFTDWSLTECIERDYAYDVDADTLVREVKAFLLEHHRFTGVSDTSMLRARTARESLVRFEDQRYQGLPVRDTPIVVNINSRGVFRVGGHWYPDIYVPEHDAVSIAEAQESLLGMELGVTDFSGQVHLYEVTADAFPEEATADKIILPATFDDRIELHVVWRVEVWLGDMVTWHVFVDTTTGERLGTVTLIES